MWQFWRTFCAQSMCNTIVSHIIAGKHLCALSSRSASEQVNLYQLLITLKAHRIFCSIQHGCEVHTLSSPSESTHQMIWMPTKLSQLVQFESWQSRRLRKHSRLRIHHLQHHQLPYLPVLVDVSLHFKNMHMHPVVELDAKLLHHTFHNIFAHNIFYLIYHIH